MATPQIRDSFVPKKTRPFARVQPIEETADPFLNQPLLVSAVVLTPRDENVEASPFARAVYRTYPLASYFRLTAPQKAEVITSIIPTIGTKHTSPVLLQDCLRTHKAQPHIIRSYSHVPTPHLLARSVYVATEDDGRVYILHDIGRHDIPTVVLVRPSREN